MISGKKKIRIFSAFLFLLFLCACGEDESGEKDTDFKSSTRKTFRVLSANLTSGSSQSYEDAGKRILTGLKPDIALIQEFNYKSSGESDLKSFIQEVFGEDFYFYRGLSHSCGYREIPNGIVSRFPILEKGTWRDDYNSCRGFDWAVIDIPGENELLALSIHLKSGESSGSVRARETAALVELIKDKREEGWYLIVGGDFNTYNRDEECVKNLSEILKTDVPHPSDDRNSNSSNDRRKPYDWLLTDSNLDTLQIPVTVGSMTSEHGHLFDTRRHSDFSDLSPIEQGDSAVSGMQHMALIKEFKIR